MEDDRRAEVSPSGSIPIVVAVTGHRTLRRDDLTGLQAQVEAALLKLLREVAPSPLVVLSALSEGADKLVADVVLKLRATHSRLRLVVPLPMPLRACREDFADPVGHEKTVVELLERADASFVLPLSPGTTVDDLCGDAALRADHYARLGRFFVRHSHVLIALWDGREGGGRGGTADIVVAFTDSAMHLELSGASPLSGPQGLRLLHFPAQRADGAQGSELVIPTLSERRAQGVLLQIREFNKDLHERSNRLVPVREASRAGLLGGDPVARVDPAAEAIVATFTAADVLSGNVYRRKRHAMNRGLFGLGAAAILTFAVYAHLAGSFWWLVVAYALLTGAAAMLLDWTRTDQVEHKYLVYRSLAEALRVEYFWRMAGVENDAADHYEVLQEREVEWVRQALNAVCLSCSAAPPTGDSPMELERIRSVNTEWVASQRDWFATRIRENRRRLRRTHGISLAFLWVGIVTTGLLLLTHMSASRCTGVFWLEAVAGVLLIGLTVLHRKPWRALTGHGKDSEEGGPPGGAPEKEPPPPGRRVTLALLGGWSVLAAVALFTMGFSLPASSEHLRHELITILIVAFGGSAVAHEYGRTMVYGPQMQRYHAAWALYRRAKQQMDRLLRDNRVTDQARMNRARALLVALGREALAENTAWLTLHRDHPLEISTHA